MQSSRYIAFCIKKFEDESFYGKYISSVNKRAYYLTKYNIHQIAKFTIDFSKGEFGFFYWIFYLNKCNAVGCRSPPKQSKPKNLDCLEEITVKRTPKKVFVLENGNYKELSYQDFCSFKENDISYMDKFFIPLHGMLMEVTEEQYKEFYRQKRRQKYIDERSAENEDFSYDMLTTDAFNGEDILVDEREPLDEQVIRKIMTDKLKFALPLLTEDEQKFIREIFYEELSERSLAKKYGVSQVAIHKRKVKILEKLKKLLEN